MKKFINVLLVVLLVGLFVGCSSGVKYENDYISLKHPKEFEMSNNYEGLYFFQWKDTGTFSVTLSKRASHNASLTEAVKSTTNTLLLLDPAGSKVEKTEYFDVDGVSSAIVYFGETSYYSAILIIDYSAENYIRVSFNLPRDDNGNKMMMNIIKSIKIK